MTAELRTWRNELKKGDNLAVMDGTRVVDILAVERTTKTMILAEHGWRFRRSDGRQCDDRARYLHGTETIAPANHDAAQQKRGDKAKDLLYAGHAQAYHLSNEDAIRIVAEIERCLTPTDEKTPDKTKQQ